MSLFSLIIMVLTGVGFVGSGPVKCLYDRAGLGHSDIRGKVVVCPL